MLRRSLGIHLYPTPVENVANVKSGGVPFWVMWQLGKDTSHEPDGFEYPNGGRLEMDGDSWGGGGGGQSKGYDIISLQTVPCHIVSNGNSLA